MDKIGQGVRKEKQVNNQVDKLLNSLFGSLTTIQEKVSNKKIIDPKLLFPNNKKRGPWENRLQFALYPKRHERGVLIQNKLNRGGTFLYQ